MLIVAGLVAACVVWGVAYKRFRATPSDPDTLKPEVVAPPPLPTKSPLPRALNEKERLLVGTWQFENVDSDFYSPGYWATYEFAPDGTFTFSFSSEFVKHWSRRGIYRVTGDVIVKEGSDGTTSVNLIEELTASRLVISVQDGRDRLVKHWSRVR